MTGALLMLRWKTALGGLRNFGARARLSAVARRFFVAVALGNLGWEVMQLPLFTLWRTARASYVAFAAFHCWLGDLLIASACLAVAILVTDRGWPVGGYGRTAAVSVLLGIGYTVFSEWLNEHVRETWSYAPAMPRVPPLGTGLSPLLQWIVVPTIAFLWARRALLPVRNSIG